MAEDIFGKVIDFISGTEGEAGDRRLLLQKLQRDIAQNKYGKFYRVRQEELDVPFAETIYSLYRIIRPIQAITGNPRLLERLKLLSVETFLDRPMVEAIERLNPDSIEKSATDRSHPEVAMELKEDVSKLEAQFTTSFTATVDHLFIMNQALLNLASFNYTAFLSKFDEKFLPQPDYRPAFRPIKAVPLVSDIAHFGHAITQLNLSGDWKLVLHNINALVQMQIPLDDAVKMLNDLQDIRSSGIIDLIIQYTLKNPSWVNVLKSGPQGQLASDWLIAKKDASLRLIDRIISVQRDERMAALADSVFGTYDINRLQNYTTRASDDLASKGLNTFKYAAVFNYLFAFIEDFAKRELQELYDIVLVRGQWTNQNQSKEMSEAFYELIKLTEGVRALDDSLSEDGKEGQRLNAALSRVEHDNSQVYYVNNMVGSINDDAQEIVESASRSMEILTRRLKELVEDSQKKPGDIIINWRQLNMVSRTPIAQRLVEDYEKVSTFYQLLQLYVESADE